MTEKNIKKLVNFSILLTQQLRTVHGDPDKLDSFADERSQGNFRKVTPEYEKLLLKTIDKTPEKYGYEFGRWTAARLATYLEQVTGIKLSGSQISRILHKKIRLHLGKI